MMTKSSNKDEIQDQEIADVKKRLDKVEDKVRFLDMQYSLITRKTKPSI